MDAGIEKIFRFVECWFWTKIDERTYPGINRSTNQVGPAKAWRDFWKRENRLTTDDRLGEFQDSYSIVACLFFGKE